MPKAVASGILSFILVVTWSGIYFSTCAPRHLQLEELGAKDIIRTADDGLDYPMDDPSNYVTTDVTDFPTSYTTKSNTESTTETVTETTYTTTGVTETSTDITFSTSYTETSTETSTAFEITESTSYSQETDEVTETTETSIEPLLKTSLGKSVGSYYDKYETTTTRSKHDLYAWMRYKTLTAKDKRNHVKKMMRHAWDNYVKYAWGGNELRSISKSRHYGSVFGYAKLGGTIVDSLDTLHVMGLMEEYEQGRNWVVNELNVSSIVSSLSVFEVNIRMVGGLLTCYSLTGDTVFRDKAQEIADKLLPAFNTPTGIPHALVDFDGGSSRNYGWASNGCSILSELGTLQLEFAYLSDVTGNPIYRNKTKSVIQYIHKLQKPRGLYPNFISSYSGKWCENTTSIGAMGDSFYEYLLKVWLQSNKEDEEAREMYDEAMQAILQHMLQVSPGGLSYFATAKYNYLEHRMEHLGCFVGGLLALGATTLKNEMSSRYLEVGKEITRTCHESYDRSYTKLGPEVFRFTGTTEAKTDYYNEDHYILRPEVVESYFYLYRLTKDPKYRDWGWEAVEALERYCKVEGGYTGITNVYSEDHDHDGVQQSFFLAETLKYLYLLFCDDSVFSLDEWVFNTEAHPLPIKDVNPYYRGIM